MKKPKVRIFALAFMCSLLFSVASFASHVVGMDLNYVHLTGDTYQINLVLYSDCGEPSHAADSTMPIGVAHLYICDTNRYVASIHLNIVPPDSGLVVSPFCSDSTQCVNMAFAIPGVKRYTYSGTYTVPSHSRYWRFIYTGDMNPGSTSARAAVITNIVNAQNTLVQLIDTLNDLAGPNSSTAFTNIATPFFTENFTNNYNPGGADPDGDSLVYSFTNAQNGTGAGSTGASVTYLTGYSPYNPLGTPIFTNFCNLNSTNGQVSFYPLAQYRNVVVYNVREYRAGVLVGSCQREMTFTVLSGSSAPPTVAYDSATAGTILSPYIFHTPPTTGSFSIFMNPTEADTTNAIVVTDTLLPAGSTFTVTGNGTPHPACTFSWSTTGVPAGVYPFFVSLTSLGSSLCNTSSFAFAVVIDTAGTYSGVLDNSFAQFSVVPNPATNSIRIIAPEMIKLVQICDLSGRELLYRDGREQTEFFDVSGLAPGTYMIRVNDLQHQKFVKY